MFRRSSSAVTFRDTPFFYTLGSGEYNYQSPDVAMKVSAVYSCVKLISESVAKLPLLLDRWNGAQGYYCADTESPLYTLLRYKPNRSMTIFDFLRSAISGILLNGNAYIYPLYGAGGDVVALILLSPYSVSYEPITDRYHINDAANGIYDVCDSYRIIHLRNVGVDGGRTGLSTIALAARTLNISVSADNETISLFKDGGRQKGIISGENGIQGFGGMQEKQLDVVRKRVETELSGGRNIVTLPGTMKFTPFSMTPADVQMLSNKEFTVKEIGRFFRVNPSMLYEGTGGGSYSNAEMDQVTFLNQTLSPFLVQLETELLTKLLPRSLWGKSRIHFDREPMYTTDLTTQSNYIKNTIESGVKTVNEWRRELGRAPVEGGDTPMMSANVVTMKSRINEGDNNDNNNKKK